MSDLEKHTSSRDEREDALQDFGLPPDPDAHLDQEEKEKIEKQLVWRLDLILIPWLCLLYLLAFLDRTNIGNAKVAGLLDDLDLSIGQYNIALTIFFISYSVFEPLTNVLLKKLKPSLFIPSIMFFWGASMVGMGFCYNYSGLLAARWFLGLAEAGLFPGVNYYLSCWYKRSEFGIRAAIFFSAAALAGSFGGLLAAAIEKLDGKGGLEGWRWIFVLEGLLTVVVAVASFWMVHDFPDDARFLTPDDRARVIRRLKMDQQASAQHEEWNTRYLYDGLKDWKMCVIGIVGFILLIASDSPAVKYAATFLGALGIYPCISNTITWMANNTEGVYKRGVVLGFVIGWGNLNGIVSSNIFFDGPRYLQGHGVIVAYMTLFLFGGSLLMTILLRIENKKRREGKRDYLAEGKSEAELELLGDRRPDFFYTT
ncbi:hypothetical protein GQX73_g9346 [Xylaria multiplex]|uniref:Major facilitator superfamily (MFS) profile domain-containing protein n=1 Tax=Xylaria multiplex TaxID=323545 RepID=A0A7C8IL36_9PEZI|nr:hypothetical protein GQX73_g9346 [Xylaria multiplex]